MIQKTYKYRIYPTQQQAILLAKHFGCCRFVYNWALEQRIKHYQETGKTIHKFELSNMLTRLRSEKEFLCEVAAKSIHQQINHLDEAYQRFFSKQNRFPKFKKKSGKQSCVFPQDNRVDFESSKLFVIKFKEGIRCEFHRRFEGKVRRVAIKKTNSTNKYFAFILVETPGELPSKSEINPETTIGIDVGIAHFATLSTGEKIDNPRFLNNSLKRLKVLQRRASRKKKGSANRKKAYKKVAKLHEKITDQRSDFIHKLTTRLISENQTIVAETLNIEGMKQNRRLSQAISDVGWGEVFRQLKYKSEWYGKNFCQIGQFEPSSKICGYCGTKKEKLDLSDRTWTCGNCLAIHDRDENAAENIKKFGLKQTGQGMPEEPAEVLAMAGPLKQETLF